MRCSLLLPILRRHATWPALFLLAALSLTLTTSAQSPAPAWWVEREVIVPTASADNSAVANIGQLKHLAAMAVEEMNAKLPMRDGAGEELEEWVASWTATGTDDYAAVNVGQLKALAQRFYDRLAYIGLEGNVPWDGVADDFALANIGQVKQVFAIEFYDPLDTDADGLADAWEMEHFGHLNYTGADDPDEDGYANIDEFLGGTYPVYGMDQGSYGGGGSGPFQGGSTPTDSESIPISPLEFSGSVLELEGAPSGASGPCKSSKLKNGSFVSPTLQGATPWPTLDSEGNPQQTHEFIEPMHWKAMDEATLGPMSWYRFFWRPVVGDNVELQKFQDAVAWGGGQFAELDGHRIGGATDGLFAHGIKQVVQLRRGMHLLSFDYRGRRESWAQSVAFKVSAQSAHSPATRVEVAPLIPAPGTQLEWKRATVLIEVKGGPPGDLRQQVEIAFELHETDTPDGVGPRIDNVCLLPMELILDSNNIAYKPDSEALGVSNYVTNNELPATSQFGDTNPDPENFRLQARLPNATTNSVQMKLEVKRDGSVVTTHNYTLDKKDGDLVRGQFLRLVTDTNDDAESGDQTILVKLGDKIKVSYDIAAGSKVEQEIQVGRPSSEDNNEADKPWKHDIRELKVRIIIVKDSSGNPCVTEAQVTQDVADANERLAQSAIRIKRTATSGEVVSSPTGFTGNYSGSAGRVSLPTADERLFAPLKDSDNNTVDVFYVPIIINTGNGDRAVSYPQERNTSGNAIYSNWVVISATNTAGENAGGGKPNTLPHELMHILLNGPHRGSSEPATALFKGGTTTTKDVGGTKRIGPYPAAKAAGIGQDDTTTIRSHAETLP